VSVRALVIAAVAGIAAFVGLLAAVGAGGATALDRTGFDAARDLRTSLVIDLAKVVTAFGTLPAVGLATVAAAIVLAAERRRRDALVLVGGLVVVALAVHVAKAADARPRPPGGLVGTAGASFPSGHAAYSVVWVALALLLARAVAGRGRRTAILALAALLALAIGWSRVELRAHYLTDVLGGWGLATAVLAACAIAGLLVERVRHHGRSR
jgi:undecaprenyl-diphosphatase